MKLAIISHTLHYKDTTGALVGWGPTITELNHLTAVFDEIYHIAVLSEEEAPKSAIAYTSDKIHFIPLKKVGGKTFKDKLYIVGQIPQVIATVNKTLKKVDVFQLRTPTAMGVYLIPYLTLFSKKRGWYKYAGNWKEEHAALGFTLQRWLLKKQHRKVTINGRWNDQQKQCITFENPCLTTIDRLEGKEQLRNKQDLSKLNFCFVGTFYKRKGIDKILEALEQIDTKRIGTFYFVGGGENEIYYKSKASKLNLDIQFTGFSSKIAIKEIYVHCHFIVLPSENEGFPKVIGEAMNFGCIPIVSNVSCIGQYIENDKNGYLIEPNTSEALIGVFNDCKKLSIEKQQKIRVENYNLAEKFTYAYYNTQIKTQLLEIE